VRIKNIEKRFRDFREIVVSLQMYSAGQEGEALDETLDVRVFTSIRFQQ
jgi:hypothetical protein